MKNKLKKLLYELLASQYSFLTIDDVELVIPERLFHGDISSNIAFKIASKTKRSISYETNIIISLISKDLKLSKYISKVSLGGAGYINFILKSKPIIRALSQCSHNNYLSKFIIIRTSPCSKLISAKSLELINSSKLLSLVEKKINKIPILKMKLSMNLAITTLNKLGKLDDKINIPTIRSTSNEFFPMVLQRVDGSYTKYAILLTHLLSCRSSANYMIIDNSTSKQLSYFIKTLSPLFNKKLFNKVEVVNKSVLFHILKNTTKTINARINKIVLINNRDPSNNLDVYERKIGLHLLDFFDNIGCNRPSDTLKNIQERMESINKLITIKLSHSSDLKTPIMKTLVTQSWIS